eukprot:ctg_2359.g439
MRPGRRLAARVRARAILPQRRCADQAGNSRRDGSDGVTGSGAKVVATDRDMYLRTLTPRDNPNTQKHLKARRNTRIVSRAAGAHDAVTTSLGDVA